MMKPIAIVSFLLIIGSPFLVTTTVSFQSSSRFISTRLSKPTIGSNDDTNDDDNNNPSSLSSFFTTRRILLEKSSSSRRTPSSSSSSRLYGIPKMFRWLTDQYPDIINRQLEVGLSSDLKVDNFYLDMNGIIHPCTHGNAEGEIVVLDETAMFKRIFLYVDRLYKLVKPSQLLYLAVDGVAPRAKMNQQRSRRFRSAKEAEAAAQEIVDRQNYMVASAGLSETQQRKRKKKAQEQEELLKKRFDSNCITPGTDFMLKLNMALAKWVEFKIETDPFWKNGADVVISGPDIPGEGEHKVMDYIRDSRDRYYNKQSDGNDDNDDDEQKEVEHWRPGCTHVLYGLDADLIMLGLVTHENNFHLLREKMSVVMAGRGRNKRRKKKDMMEYDKNDFEVLELTSLRKLLAIQFRRFADEGTLKVEYDLNRIVDDFVFMCMLVGNDFLPHCPHLEIDSGAISMMISSYTELLPEWGGYLTEREKIHPKRCEEFIYHLAVYEEEHFKRRGYEENEPGWNLSTENELDDDLDFYGTYYSGKPTPDVAVPANSKQSPDNGAAVPPPPPRAEKEKEAEEPAAMATGPNRKFRRRHPGNQSRSYRDFYYESKMGWPVSDRSRTLFQRRAHVRDYLEGLHWNLNYYHNGCRSWDWFFPHLYSPLATDMVNLDEFYHTNNDDNEENDDDDGFRSFPFELGTPFPSLAQLLAVLPPQSAPLLPKPLADLMINPVSPLMDYYPPDFTTDPNGKRQSWEAVVQIPFIDADVLLDTVQCVLDADQAALEKAAEDEDDETTTIQPLLTNAERLRNARGKSYLFVPKRDGAAEEAEEEEEAATKRGIMKRTKTRKGAAKNSRQKKGSKKGAAAKKPRPKKGSKTPTMQ